MRVERNPMIRLGTGQGRGRLDAVKARKPFALRSAASSEAASGAQLIGALTEWIRIEANEDARPLESWHDLQRPSISEHRAIARAVLVDRLVGVPRGFRKQLQQIINLLQQGRRGHASGEQPKAFAAALMQLLKLPLQCLPKRFSR